MLFCTKKHRFVEYTPRKCFNSFVRSAVDARRQGDKNSTLSVVVEKMKLLANSSYRFQIWDRSRHFVTMNLSDETTHAAITSKPFSKVNHLRRHYVKLNSPKQKLNTKNQSVLGFYAPIRKIPNVGFLLQSFSLNWCIQVRSDGDGDRFSILLLPRRNRKIVSDQKWRKSGRAWRSKDWWTLGRKSPRRRRKFKHYVITSLRQQTEVSEQTITLLQLTLKLRKAEQTITLLQLTLKLRKVSVSFTQKKIVRGDGVHTESIIL